MDHIGKGAWVFDISVVVIVYNDADRLPRAVQSALDQTLRGVEVVIVDDCSTDRSHLVARELAARHPERVRAFQLPSNSGGCGEPRNRGIAEARGRYVMFLDSDDELERNACRNMLDAATRTGADLVSGLCVRVHVDSRHGKTVEWYPWLYARSRTLESVAELPDLLVFDTLSTNKCYRRDFLLAEDLLFPRGIHYEDLLFSAQAYLAAERIALIPNQVYFWNVADRAPAKSISNRRHEIANFAHRLEIHRRIDALLEQRNLLRGGFDELRLAKDVKFLKHDLVLHLRDLPFRDLGYRHEFASLARGYLAEIAPDAYASLEPIQAICAYLLVREDWPNLMTAIDTLINRDKLSSPLIEREGRIYWCAEHLDDAQGRRVLDVTELGYHAKPIDRMFLRNKLDAYREDAAGVHLSGRIVNPLGSIPPSAALSGTLEFRARRRSLQTFRFPVGALRHDGDAVAWEASADLARRLRPLGVIDAVWDVRVILQADGRSTTTRLTVGDLDVPGGTLRVRPRLTRLVADRIEPQTTARGHLAFRLASRGRASVRTRRLMRRGAQGTPGLLARAGFEQVKRARRALRSGNTKIRVYHEVLCRLPVRKGTAVFESHLGKQYSDSPKAIYEELRERGAPIRAVWSYASRTEGFPKDAELVRRWSWRYLLALATAEFWVDNQGYPLKLAKRPQTTYIQTWHGSALKKMGFDEPGYKARGREQQEEYQRVLDRFDHFLVRTEHDVRTLVPAFRLPESKVLRVGYPRNDALVRARTGPGRLEDEDEGAAAGAGPALTSLAQELGIPEDRTVVLYVPTFRSAANGKARRFELPFDVERFADRFGDRCTLLVRSHYLNHVVLPPSVRGRVIDVSGVHDITPLYLLADALVTDYSSAMFDYALLDRPLVFYAYDYDEYVRDTRGTYFDLREHAPGPVVLDEDALFEVIDDLESADKGYVEQRRRFVERFGEYDQGTAARSVVERFFLPQTSRSRG